MEKLKDKIRKVLGPEGYMLSGSKGRYQWYHPKNLIVFNSNLCIVVGNSVKKVWYGDLDLTLSHLKLKKLSKTLKTPIYVLNELDGRFDNEDNPLVDKAVAVFMKNGQIILGDEEFSYLTPKGTPKAYTDKELLARTPPPPEPAQEYNESDYIPIKVPSFGKFKGSERSGSPIDKFQDFWIKNYGLEMAKDFYMNMSWTESQEESLLKLCETYLRDVKGVKCGYELNKALAWAVFDTPNVFKGTPKWVKPGFVYIKRGRKRNE